MAPFYAIEHNVEPKKCKIGPNLRVKTLFFEKTCWNIWWVGKKGIPLHPHLRKCDVLWQIFIDRNCSTRNTMRPVISLDMENDYAGWMRLFFLNDILQWRVWSWLRMNASYRLNTCKSRGSMKVACYFWWRPAHGCVTRIQSTHGSGIALRK